MRLDRVKQVIETNNLCGMFAGNPRAAEPAVLQSDLSRAYSHDCLFRTVGNESQAKFIEFLATLDSEKRLEDSMAVALKKYLKSSAGRQILESTLKNLDIMCKSEFKADLKFYGDQRTSVAAKGGSVRSVSQPLRANWQLAVF